MPEILEVEMYRRAAETVVGHTILGVDAPDAWFLKRGLTPAVVQRALKKRMVTAARRRGKLLLLDTDGPVLGLRFGMTGRLVVDGRAVVTDMEYGSERDLPGWDRFQLHFDGRRTLRINDPRRLGGVELDPDESALGADAFDLTIAELRTLLRNSTAPVKARLMDQQRVAGIGNLLADEILWRAGIDPARLSRDLDTDAVRRLHRTIRTVLRDLMNAEDLTSASCSPSVSATECAPTTARRCYGARSAVARPIRARFTSDEWIDDVKDSSFVMVSRRRRLALGALVFVVAGSIPTVAMAQTTTPPASTTAAPTPTTAGPVTTVRPTATTRRTATTVRRTTTVKTVATTEAPTTTAAPTTVATTVASTIPPTTIALVTAASVTAARANDASSTRTVNGVIVGLFVLAGLVALLTAWFYKRTAPLPASLEMLEFMSRRQWRKAPATERDAQLVALRSQIGEVPPENIVNLHPVPIERPPWRPSEVPDDSVADALVGLVPPPPEVEANGIAGDTAVADPSPVPAADEPGDRPADTLDPHG